MILDLSYTYIHLSVPYVQIVVTLWPEHNSHLLHNEHNSHLLHTEPNTLFMNIYLKHDDAVLDGTGGLHYWANP